MNHRSFCQLRRASEPSPCSFLHDTIRLMGLLRSTNVGSGGVFRIGLGADPAEGRTAFTLLQDTTQTNRY